VSFLEKSIYSLIIFIASYAIISLGLRVFEITSVYNSHMIGGVVATIFAVGAFLYFILKNRERES
jgi:hypothetical protein